MYRSNEPLSATYEYTSTSIKPLSINICKVQQIQLLIQVITLDIYW